MDNQQTIAFIGAGNMSGAIISGLLKNEFNPQNVWASSPTIQNRTNLHSNGICLTADNKEAAQHADIIVLGVKPHLISAVCEELKTIIAEKKPLVISLAAGTRINTILTATDQTHLPIIRAMPNIAAAVSASATGLLANGNVSEDQKAAAESLFRSIGTVFWAKTEDELDAFTPISGSGPAYLFYIFEAMQQAAESLGIEKEHAKLLIAETAIGAAKMAMESPEDFNKLRACVTSPNGTTQAATDFLTANQVKESFIDAINAAHQRTKELSQ